MSKLSDRQHHWLAWLAANGGEGTVKGGHVVASNGAESAVAAAIAFLHLIAKGAIAAEAGKLYVTDYGRRMLTP